MSKIDFKFLKKLMTTSSVSGTEFEIQKIWLNYINKFCDETKTDKIGNAIGVLNKKADYNILITAHSDQIGFMVSNIDEDGFIHVIKVGDYHPQAIPGSVLTIFSPKGIVEGVFGIKTSHMSKRDEMSKINELSDLWVDIGVKNKKKAEKQVAIGNFAVIRNQVRKSNGYLTCSAFDDKIGIYIIASVLKELSKLKLNVKVTAVSSVHEEIGGFGINAVQEKENFDSAIFIDTGFASDFPGNNNKNRWGNIKLDGGPIISSASVINHLVRRKILQIAKKQKINTQQFAEGCKTGTDLDKRYHLCPSALISIPCRYMHTPVETIHENDVKNVIKLCSSFIKDLKGNEKFDPFEDISK